MIPRVGPEGMLFGKPASTPDQVRGRLFLGRLRGGALATSRRKIDLSALWSTVPGDAKPAGDDRRGLPSVALGVIADNVINIGRAIERRVAP